MKDEVASFSDSFWLKDHTNIYFSVSLLEEFSSAFKI